MAVLQCTVTNKYVVCRTSGIKEGVILSSNTSDEACYQAQKTRQEFAPKKPKPKRLLLRVSFIRSVEIDVPAERKEHYLNLQSLFIRIFVCKCISFVLLFQARSYPRDAPEISPPQYNKEQVCFKLFVSFSSSVIFAHDKLRQGRQEEKEF